MKKMAIALSLGVLIILGSACEKQINDDSTVNIFLIESYENIDSTCQIDESSIVCRETPLIAYEEIISYDKSTYTFKISDIAIDSVENFYTITPRPAFAIKVDEELIYTGYFWPSFYSMSCQWVVIDPLALSVGNKMTVNLGYPSLIEGFEIPDNRNDDRIIATFKKDGKLKK